MNRDVFKLLDSARASGNNKIRVDSALIGRELSYEAFREILDWASLNKLYHSAEDRFGETKESKDKYLNIIADSDDGGVFLDIYFHFADMKKDERIVHAPTFLFL